MFFCTPPVQRTMSSPGYCYLNGLKNENKGGNAKLFNMNNMNRKTRCMIIV